jgi:hypothetical protein
LGPKCPAHGLGPDVVPSIGETETLTIVGLFQFGREKSAARIKHPLS